MHGLKYITFIFLFLIGLSTIAQTTISQGSYTDPSIWDNGQVPNSRDDVQIGHFVWANGKVRTNDLTILSTGTLQTFSFRTTRIDGDLSIAAGGALETAQNCLIFGDYEVNGIHISENRIRLRNDGLIQGTGTVSGTDTGDFDFHIKQSNRTIAVGSDITFQGGQFGMGDNQTITNNGKVSIEVLRANNQSSRWINNENATLEIKENIIGLALFASANNNEVIYSTVSGDNNEIYRPSASLYHHLTISGENTNSCKKLYGYMKVLGNLRLDNAKLCAQPFRYEYVEIAGDWISNGGVFEPGNSAINFTRGSGLQHINSDNVQTFYNLSVRNNGSLGVNNDLSVRNDLNIQGNFSMEGEGNYDIYLGRNMFSTNPLSLPKSKITFDGTTIQTMGCEIRVAELHLKNPASVALSGKPVQVLEYINMEAGNFYTNGQLTLKSTADKTANVGPIPNNYAVYGNVTYERYLEPTVNGWSQLSIPIQNKSWRDIDDDIITTGFADADFLLNGWINIRKYNESATGNLNKGFYPIANLDEQISATAGYFVFYAPDQITIEASGIINQQNYTFDVSYTPNDTPANTAWNLLSNPYPSTIDWNKEDGWQKNNLSSAVYLYSAQANQYSSYINGIGINGGSRYIPSGQAFWVKTNGTNPSLSINENAKANKQVAYRNTEIPPSFFKIIVSNADSKDELAISYDSTASLGYDEGLDAYKFLVGETGIDFGSITSDGTKLSINTIGEVDMETILPLYLSIPSDGTFDFMTEKLAMFEQFSCVRLRDHLMKKDHILSDINPISLQIGKTDSPERFSLIFMQKISSTTLLPNCVGSADGSIALAKGMTDNFNIAWLNESSEKIATNVDYIDGLPAGFYTVQLQSLSAKCGTITQVIELPEAEAISANEAVQDVLCQGAETGAISLNPGGGLAPYTTIWQDNSTLQTRADLAAGSYFVSISDSNGCVKDFEFDIEEAVAPNIQIEMTPPLCAGTNTGAVQIIVNSGVAPFSIAWEDGESELGRSNLAKGTYAFTVYDGNGCAQSGNVNMVGGEEFLADFTFDGLPTSNGYNAIFMAESEAENYLWDFGDGKTSTQTSPMHTYALGSTYTASLTATSGPCEATFTQEVVAFITTIVDAQTTNIQLKKSANNLSINGLQIGQEYSVEIFNALGQIIYHKNIANAADRVDLTLPYTSGVMLIKLFQNGRSLAVLKVL